MDNLAEYAVQSIAARLVHVDELPGEGEPVYCCPEMEMILSQIDGMYFYAEDAAEFDRLRKTPEYLELVRQKNTHKCLSRLERPEVARRLLETTEGTYLGQMFRKALEDA